MKPFRFLLIVLLALSSAASLPTAHATSGVPDGLTAADWAQIQSQLDPQAIAAYNQQAKLTASDAAASDWFGSSVAVSGDTAVIGAHLDDDGGDASGSAYVFTHTSGVWSQQAKLTASDAVGGDLFGFSVAISGDTAVIGAYLDDDGGSDSGSAYVFTRTGGVWSQQAKLTASDAAGGDSFGVAVAVSGETAVIGAGFDDDGGSGSGSAYVFTRTGGVWSEQAKLTANDPAMNDEFGRAVAVSGDTAVIGANGDDSFSGSAYVFTRMGGVWSQQAKLIANDAAVGDFFGIAVAVSGDTAVIGAYQDDDGGSDSGSAYVFTRTGGGWSQQAKLIANDAAVTDLFGFSVAVSGDTAVIGANGDDDGGNASGSAYVFIRTDGEWSQQAKLTASEAAGGDRFGIAVAVSGDTAIIGAHLDDDGGDNSGSAYVFDLSHPLAVTTSGTGGGNIASTPSGIDCGLECEASFAPSTVVTLTATADIGATFTGWSGDVVTTTNPIAITMDSAKAITATFALNQYTITLLAEPAVGGTVAGGGSVTHGQMVTATATAEVGYIFLHWAEGGDVISTAASYSFPATADRVLIAHFAADAPKIYLPLVVR